MTAKILLSPAARQDLREIWRYSMKSGGGERADAYIADLHAAFARLALFPGAGRLDERYGEGIRLSRAGLHLSIHRPAEGAVEIIRVVHGQLAS
jgi:toxin ParE1/3/4